MCYAFADRINRTCKNLDDLAEGRGFPPGFLGWASGWVIRCVKRWKMLEEESNSTSKGLQSSFGSAKL